MARTAIIAIKQERPGTPRSRGPDRRRWPTAASTVRNAQLAAARSTFAQIGQAATGVSFCGSLIAISDVTDGASQTYLLGEKRLYDNYLNGVDNGDNGVR